ncbi:MAG: GntR family transcriptional regulator [Paracoccaceae bacterium]|nr:GntR family transcriptional regulator [Paracoccaceae bacterium]
MSTITIERMAAPLRQRVLNALREAIISGQLKPGARLIERELISMISVSRTVIREALRQLETEGLVDMVPNKGPVVRILTAEEARDLYRIRAVLEGLAARLFVENANALEKEKLRASLTAVGIAYDRGDAEGVLECKNRFYEILNTGARSDSLVTMLITIHARIWRWRALGLKHAKRSQTRSKQSLENLETIVKAIETGDADKAEAVTHFETHEAANEVLRLLDRTEHDIEAT